MTEAQLVESAKSLIDDLARTPRFAGSAEEARARAQCRSELETAGFTCKDIPFSYSQLPGRWGPPVFAAFIAAVIVSAAERGVRETWSGFGVVYFLIVFSMFYARRFF